MRLMVGIKRTFSAQIFFINKLNKSRSILLARQECIDSLRGALQGRFATVLESQFGATHKISSVN
jgi:hypothetical protein